MFKFFKGFSNESDFDPPQFESKKAIEDSVEKLIMAYCEIQGAMLPLCSLMNDDIGYQIEFPVESENLLKQHGYDIYLRSNLNAKQKKTKAYGLSEEHAEEIKKYRDGFSSNNVDLFHKYDVGSFRKYDVDLFNKYKLWRVTLIDWIFEYKLFSLLLKKGNYSISQSVDNDFNPVKEKCLSIKDKLTSQFEKRLKIESQECLTKAELKFNQEQEVERQEHDERNKDNQGTYYYFHPEKYHKSWQKEQTESRVKESFDEMIENFSMCLGRIDYQLSFKKPFSTVKAVETFLLIHKHKQSIKVKQADNISLQKWLQVPKSVMFHMLTFSGHLKFEEHKYKIDKKNDVVDPNQIIEQPKQKLEQVEEKNCTIF